MLKQSISNPSAQIKMYIAILKLIHICDDILVIESIKNTSMEDVSTKVLEKIKNNSRR